MFTGRYGMSSFIAQILFVFKKLTSTQSVAEAATYTKTQEKKRLVLSGIRTRNPSTQAPAELRLRPQGHRDHFQ
jgi:hypothetical protein